MTTFSSQANSCFINGYCFAANESNPIDWCYQCIPGVNASAWTKRQGNVTAAQFSSQLWSITIIVPLFLCQRLPSIPVILRVF